jgi:hypothetical protein
MVGTFSTGISYSNASIGGSTGGGDTMTMPTTVKDKEVGGHTNVCVWRLSTGEIEYVIKGDSIGVNGPWDTGDSLSLDKFFDDLSRAAVAQGVSRGYTPCVATGVTTSRVLVPSCVSFSGTGSNRTLTACGTSYCPRTFQLSCTAGQNTPTITLLPAPPHGPLCTGTGCQSTCR